MFSLTSADSIRVNAYHTYNSIVKRGFVQEMLAFSKQVKTIAIIAEGVPESQTRVLNKLAKKAGVGIIGPATVGGIKVRLLLSIVLLRIFIVVALDSSLVELHLPDRKAMFAFVGVGSMEQIWLYLIV